VHCFLWIQLNALFFTNPIECNSSLGTQASELQFLNLWIVSYWWVWNILHCIIQGQNGVEYSTPFYPREGNLFHCYWILCIMFFEIENSTLFVKKLFNPLSFGLWRKNLSIKTLYSWLPQSHCKVYSRHFFILGS